MPHLTLEYSGNVPDPPDIQGILREIHRVLQETAGIKIANCKSRGRIADEYVVADGGSSHAFVHLDVRILEGRSVELKKELGNRLLETLREHFSSAEAVLDLQTTVEIRDIERASYFKHPEGTLTIL